MVPIWKQMDSVADQWMSKEMLIQRNVEPNKWWSKKLWSKEMMVQRNYDSEKWWSREIMIPGKGPYKKQLESFVDHLLK